MNLLSRYDEVCEKFQVGRKELALRAIGLVSAYVVIGYLMRWLGHEFPNFMFWFFCVHMLMIVSAVAYGLYSGWHPKDLRVKLLEMLRKK